MEFKEHTFVIVAYKESQFLEKCINSLLAQECKSNIIIATSTPNYIIESFSKKYNLPLFINSANNTGIASDWNYALHCSDSKYVTLAHQDDIYFPEFTKELYLERKKLSKSIISFSNYFEISNDIIVKSKLLLSIKKILLLPFYLKKYHNLAFVKKSVLIFGSPICCPSVTYNLELLHNFKFNETLKVSLDWDAWYTMAKMKGGFLFFSKSLMAHRIHEESETTKCIEENIREREDSLIFNKIWGLRVANLIMAIFKTSYTFNNTES